MTIDPLPTTPPTMLASIQEVWGRPRDSFWWSFWWLLSASASALTTKYLFQRGMHYPLFILWLQLSALLLGHIMYDRQLCRLDVLRTIRSRPNALYAFAIAGSLICSYQAMLHWPCLPTLAATLVLSWHPNLSGARAVRFGLGMFLIYFFETKLIAKGLYMTVLSSIFALVAQSPNVRQGPVLACESQHDANFAPRIHTFSLAAAAFVPVAALMLWYEARPGDAPYTGQLDYSVAVGLGLSVMFGALALSIGSHCFCRVPTLAQTTWVAESCSDVHSGLFEVLFLDVILASARLLPGTPPLVSPWQMIGFVLASWDWFQPSTKPALLERAPWGMSLKFRTGGLVLLLLLSLFDVAWPQGWQIESPSTRGIAFLNPYPRALDVVVAHYDESPDELLEHLDGIARLPYLSGQVPRVLIYVKHAEARLPDLQDVLRKGLRSRRHGEVDIVVERLPNVGREGHTYLRHILAYWDDHAHLTLFMQSGLHNPWQATRRLQHYLHASTGFLPLADAAMCASCDNCHDPGWTELPEILASLDRRNNTSGIDGHCGTLVLNYKGQFVVSAGRIRANSRAFYEELVQQIEDPNSARHDPHYTNAWLPWPDSMNQPVFAFTLERMWGPIFQCSSRHVVSRCPSLLSGWAMLPFGQILDACQCLDGW